MSEPRNDPAGAAVPPLGVIGGGAMAEAILSGAIEAGVLDPSRVAVSDPNADRRAHFESRRIHAFEPGPDLAGWLERESAGRGAQVLLAVKPQMLDAAAEAFGPSLTAVRPLTVLSILAGTTQAGLAAAFGPGAEYVRLMPNTPAAVRRGVTALATPDHPEVASFARTLFGAVGRVIEMDELMIDAFTGVAGSGPAYLFYLVESMSQAAEGVGFDAQAARVLAEETVIGAAELLRGSEDNAATLRARVTSKRGTTEAAIATLDEAGVMDAIVHAVAAARDRGQELGRS
ncbi:MAG: pyrroline-5-carboxylate reductase [Planctomycetota bacterium]